MCGIVGAFGDLERGDLPYKAMLRKLRHRGPDDVGVARGSNYFLGHRRLSIIDVEGGHQPFRSQEGDIQSVCNGEIYNFQELRSRFRSYRYSTRSDSEVLLPMYRHERSGSVKSLDGMFSFIITDGEHLFAARDPIGIKPLYFGTDNGRLYFASEAKALIGHSERIREFPNGHYYHSGEGLRPYYRFPATQTVVGDTDQAVASIRETLVASIKKRLMSDVPVGVFLSGGLDSSIVAAVMKRHVPELHSFSVGFRDSADLLAARTVAEHIGTMHHEYAYSEYEMVDALSDVIYHLESYDTALVRSAIPTYFVSRLASQHVKVVLSGEGSDELFAGYSYLRDQTDPETLQSECKRILRGLHNINLQRVDRMTMAHGLEARVPFLDLDFVGCVLRIDPRLKMYRTFGSEKWLLRKAFEDLLPPEIVWREKMEFAQGCGSSDAFERRAGFITDEELADAQGRGSPVSSKEELLYYDIFRRFFDHPDMEKLIGKWKGDLH